MSWWLVVVVLVAFAFLSGVVRGRLALTGRTRTALPEGPPANPLQERMRGLDAAIEEVRNAILMMPAATAQACAFTALSRRPTATEAGERLPARWQGSDASSIGPGTEIFERLLQRIAEIDDDDRRELADAGLDPAKIVEALKTPMPPEPWERELSRILEFVQQGLHRVSGRRYG